MAAPAGTKPDMRVLRVRFCRSANCSDSFIPCSLDIHEAYGTYPDLVVISKDLIKCFGIL